MQKKGLYLAGMLAVVLGTVSVPLIMGHSSEVTQAEFPEKSEEAAFVPEKEVTTESAQETPVEMKKSGLLCSSNVSELELHDNTRPVYTMEEVNQLIENGTDNYYNNGGKDVIDVSLCASAFSDVSVANAVSSDSGLDSLENKSYIYHMMLNSVDYFDTAKGSVTCAVDLNMPINAEFSTNIPESYAYENQQLSNGDIIDTYVYDGMIYNVTNNELCDSGYWGEPIEFDLSDNERVVTLDDGESMFINRNDLTHLAMSGSCCLFPQGYAMSRMSDFDTWHITGCEEFLNKECVVIEGNFNNGTFVMYVDINHGSMLKYEEYSASGEMTGYIETTRLEYEADVEKITFDEEV